MTRILGRIRIPWTLLTMAVVLVISLLTETHRHWIDPRHNARFGVGFEDLLHGRIWKFVTAIYFVDHPHALVSSLILLLVFLGSYEFVYGTAQTMVLWFTATPLTILLMAGVIRIGSQFVTSRSLSAILDPEVGSSDACWCALGAALGWPLRWRKFHLLVGVVISAFLAYLLYDKRDTTDLGHLLAFAVGVFAFGGWHQWRSTPQRVLGWRWLSL